MKHQKPISALLSLLGQGPFHQYRWKTTQLLQESGRPGIYKAVTYWSSLELTEFEQLLHQKGESEGVFLQRLNSGQASSIFSDLELLCSRTGYLSPRVGFQMKYPASKTAFRTEFKRDPGATGGFGVFGRPRRRSTFWERRLMRKRIKKHQTQAATWRGASRRVQEKQGDPGEFPITKPRKPQMVRKNFT